MPSHESSCRCIDEIALVNVLSVDEAEVAVFPPGCEFVSRPPTCHTLQITCLFIQCTLQSETSTMAQFCRKKSQVGWTIDQGYVAQAFVFKGEMPFLSSTGNIKALKKIKNSDPNHMHL